MTSQSSATWSDPREDIWLYVDEMSHRTLNTYAAVLAIVERAHREERHTDRAGALGEVAKRLRSAAAAHRALRPSQTMGDCRLDVELETMCAALSASLLEPRSVGLTLACDPIVLEARRCWQVCLIASELIMNAMRHAFRSGDPGEITVEVRVYESVVQCVVQDNGFSPAEPNAGGGTRILDALASYLDGALLRRYTENGSTVLLAFPLRPQQPSPLGNGS